MNILQKTKKRLLVVILLVIVLLLLLKGIKKEEKEEMDMRNGYETLDVISSSFEQNGQIPKQHTGFGEDISPAFHLESISEDAVSIAIIMDDLDIPIIGAYNHWVIWNIPAMADIPENIPYGATVTSLGDAKQGSGWGRNRYRGPKQPFFIKSMHRYVFRVYTLDCELELDTSARKGDLLKAMEGHVIQEGSILGTYTREQ